MDRRKFLKQLLATGSAAWLTSRNVTGRALADGFANPVPFVQNPSDSASLVRSFFEIDPSKDPYSVFSLSVATGDPRPHGIVLWTRIDQQSVIDAQTPVAYQIASKPSFAPDSLLVEGLAQVDASRDN